MSTRLDETIATMGADNLIGDVNPPAEVFSVKLTPGQGVLVRGSLLARNTDGTMELISSTTTGKANAILADPIDTGDPVELGEGKTDDRNPVNGIAYRTGHFNGNMLTVADGYNITAADKEALRTAGILLSDAVEI